MSPHHWPSRIQAGNICIRWPPGGPPNCERNTSAPYNLSSATRFQCRLWCNSSVPRCQML
eukprot:585016-Pyramimonas_sp.AAC.1